MSVGVRLQYAECVDPVTALLLFVICIIVTLTVIGEACARLFVYWLRRSGLSLDLVLVEQWFSVNCGYLFLPGWQTAARTLSHTFHINSLHFIIIEYLFPLKINPRPDANEMRADYRRNININGWRLAINIPAIQIGLRIKMATIAFNLRGTRTFLLIYFSTNAAGFYWIASMAYEKRRTCRVISPTSNTQ